MLAPGTEGVVGAALATNVLQLTVSQKACKLAAQDADGGVADAGRNHEAFTKETGPCPVP
jgi:hypothetical protein